MGTDNYYLLYTVKVQAYNDKGLGPMSDYANVYSAEGSKWSFVKSLGKLHVKIFPEHSITQILDKNALQLKLPENHCRILVDKKNPVL